MHEDRSRTKACRVGPLSEYRWNRFMGVRTVQTWTQFALVFIRLLPAAARPPLPEPTPTLPARRLLCGSLIARCRACPLPPAPKQIYGVHHTLWRKSSQWFGMIRAHAEIVVEDKNVYNA